MTMLGGRRDSNEIPPEIAAQEPITQPTDDAEPEAPTDDLPF